MESNVPKISPLIAATGESHNHPSNQKKKKKKKEQSDNNAVRLSFNESENGGVYETAAQPLEIYNHVAYQSGQLIDRMMEQVQTYNFPQPFLSKAELLTEESAARDEVPTVSENKVD